MAPLLVSSPAPAGGPGGAAAAVVVPTARGADAGRLDSGSSSPHMTTPGTPPHHAGCLTGPCAGDRRGLPAAFQIRPLSGEALGAEVLGLDLMRDPITPELVSAVREAVLRYQVLAFRGQEALTPDRHIEFSRHFGTLYQHALGEFRLPGYEEIVVVSNEMGKDGKGVGLNGLDKESSKDSKRHHWHSDLSYMPAPPMGSMLHMKVLPECGDGDTLFCDMYAAFATLEPELQKRLLALQARHVFFNKASDEALSKMTPEQQAIMDSVPPVTHPVVRTHPETGRKSLFVSEGFTANVVGLDPVESDALLQQLFAHSTQPRFVYRHKWQRGDMIFWDNRSTLHLATGSEQPRTLWRTTIKGCQVF